MYNIAKHFFLLYNATLFVTLASFRAWVGREVNVPNLGLATQSTVVLIEIIIWDVVLIWLNGGVSSKVDCVVGTFFTSRPHYLRQVISEL